MNKSGDAKAEYYNAGVCNLNKLLPVSEEVYNDCLDGALDYYRSFIEEQAVFFTPEPELNRVFYGVMLTADNMMNGFKPKYGNMILFARVSRQFSAQLHYGNSRLRRDRTSEKGSADSRTFPEQRRFHARQNNLQTGRNAILQLFRFGNRSAAVCYE